jgi:hypothetical protein
LGRSIVLIQLGVRGSCVMQFSGYWNDLDVECETHISHLSRRLPTSARPSHYLRGGERTCRKRLPCPLLIQYCEERVPKAAPQKAAILAVLCNGAEGKAV